MPAAFTGVVGLKPTYGRVSTYGMIPGAAVPGVEHIGVVTSSVDDAGMVLAAIAGPDPHDPRTADFLPFREPVPPEQERLRIGVLRRVNHLYQADPEVGLLVEQAVEAFAALGADVRSVELDLELAGPAHALLAASAAAFTHWDNVRYREEHFSPEVRIYSKAALIIRHVTCGPRLPNKAP